MCSCLLMLIMTRFIVIFQASEKLHKMHTLQLSRKYVNSITPERKAQVGVFILVPRNLVLHF